MHYKNLNKLIHRFSNNRWVRNVTQSINFNVIFEFLNNGYFASGMHSVIYQSNASHKRWYKGEHVYDWFQSVIVDIHNGFKPLKALANNSKIPGYKKDKTFHRKLFYKITKMVRLSIQTLCQCKTKQDLDSLNFLLTFKFGRAGRPKMPYQKTKVNNIIGYETYDDFLTRLWNFVSADTVNSKSLILNMCNDSIYHRYLKLFDKSLDTLERKNEFLDLYTIYMQIKDSEFMRKINRYRLLKILKNNGILPKTRKLGNKPKPITRIRIPGLFQVDVKITHSGDLKHHDVGYWMVIIEVEHGLVYRHFQTHKPTGKEHVAFLNEALAFYQNTYQIKAVSIQMDNAPEYAKSHNSYEQVVHEEFVKSVGDWCVLNKVKHLNIKKGRKESNGKVENSNKFIDYELLPLIHRVKSIVDIQKISKEYDWLHNNFIRRTICRIIDGKLKKIVITPVEWFKTTNNMVTINKLTLQEDSCYYRVIN